MSWHDLVQRKLAKRNFFCCVQSLQTRQIHPDPDPSAGDPWSGLCSSGRGAHGGRPPLHHSLFPALLQLFPGTVRTLYIIWIQISALRRVSLDKSSISWCLYVWFGIKSHFPSSQGLLVSILYCFINREVRCVHVCVVLSFLIVCRHFQRLCHFSCIPLRINVPVIITCVHSSFSL